MSEWVMCNEALPAGTKHVESGGWSGTGPSTGDSSRAGPVPVRLDAGDTTQPGNRARFDSNPAAYLPTPRAARPRGALRLVREPADSVGAPG